MDSKPLFLVVALKSDLGDQQKVFESSIEALEWLSVQAAFWRAISAQLRDVGSRFGVDNSTKYAAEDAFFANVESAIRGKSGLPNEEIKRFIVSYADQANNGTLNATWKSPFVAIFKLFREDSIAATQAAALAGTLHPEVQFARVMQALGNQRFDKAVEIIRAARPVEYEVIGDGVSFAEMEKRAEALKQKLTETAVRLSDEQRRLDQLHKALELRIVTSAPGELWRQRAKGHGEGVTQWLRWFVLIAFVGVVMLAIGLSSADLTLKKALEAPHTALLAFGLPLVVLFWLLKHVSRLFAQDLARLQDAQERAAILETYIALLEKEETAPSPEERRLIFEALCRSGPGAQHDGTPQESLIAGLTTALKR